MSGWKLKERFSDRPKVGSVPAETSTFCRILNIWNSVLKNSKKNKILFLIKKIGVEQGFLKIILRFSFKIFFTSLIGMPVVLNLGSLETILKHIMILFFVSGYGKFLVPVQIFIFKFRFGSCQSLNRFKNMLKMV